MPSWTAIITDRPTLRYVPKHLTQAAIGKAEHHLDDHHMHQEARTSALGGIPPFQKNTFLSGKLMEKFRN
jgi:hypothetical protein